MNRHGKHPGKRPGSRSYRNNSHGKFVKNNGFLCTQYNCCKREMQALYKDSHVLYKTTMIGSKKIIHVKLYTILLTEEYSIPLIVEINFSNNQFNNIDFKLNLDSTLVSREMCDILYETKTFVELAAIKNSSINNILGLFGISNNPNKRMKQFLLSASDSKLVSCKSCRLQELTFNVLNHFEHTNFDVIISRTASHPDIIRIDGDFSSDVIGDVYKEIVNDMFNKVNNATSFEKEVKMFLRPPIRKDICGQCSTVCECCLINDKCVYCCDIFF